MDKEDMVYIQIYMMKCYSSEKRNLAIYNSVDGHRGYAAESEKDTHCIISHTHTHIYIYMYAEFKTQTNEQA